MNVRSMVPSGTKVTFGDAADDILNDAQKATIRLHHQRANLDSPVYILLGTGRSVVATTTSEAEAKVHFHNNDHVVSYISSEALLEE